MMTPRRRILRRPAAYPAAATAREQARAERRRTELAKKSNCAQALLTRLKRATNTVAKLYAKISRA
jgi:hypothetical protein